jgi:hypothetical protein
LSRLRGLPSKGTPGRRPFIIGLAAPILAILLIVLLGPIYGQTRAWTAIYTTIAFVGFAVGTPCLLLGIFRTAQYRRSQALQSMNLSGPDDATELGRQDRVGVGGRHLLPHERWLVQNVARRNMPARNRNAARALRDYGPEGAMWWTAATANMPVALLAWVVGFALLVSTGAEGTAGDTGGCLILVALLFGLVIALRVLQCIRAGRAYRANRSNLGP